MKQTIHVSVGTDSYFFRFGDGRVETVRGLLRCLWLGTFLILRGYKIEVDDE